MAEAKTDVTHLLLSYRESVRHLWNCFLREDDTFASGSLASDAALDDWEELKQVLFRAIVLRKTGREEHAAARLQWLSPLSFLRVVTGPDVPAMISRTKGQGGYWDHPVQRLTADDDLRFIDFFEFDESRYLDLPYCQVAIQGSPQHPELVGHVAHRMATAAAMAVS
jgi:hypothetical protein